MVVEIFSSKHYELKKKNLSNYW